MRAVGCGALALAILCTNGSAAADDLPVDVARREAHADVARGEKATGAEAKALYARAGERFREIFRTYCEEPVRAGEPRRADRCDEDAYNAGRAFRAAGLGAKAIAAYRSLVAFDEMTKERSPLALRAHYEIGAAYRDLAAFDSAAEWLERCVTRDPKAARAEGALSEAIVLRLGLGETEAAVRDADRLEKLYGRTKPDKAALVAFAIASHHAEHERFDDARATLARAMPAIDAAAPLDVRLRAHALLARSALRSSRPSGTAAAQEYAVVRALFADPEAAEKKIAQAYAREDEGLRMRRLAQALVAVGEAIHAAAESKRRSEVDVLRLAPADAAKANAFVEKKSAAIEAAAVEYAKVLALRPVPPPSWAVASKARVALMWASLYDDFARARVPAAVRDPILHAKVKPALVACVDLAAKLQIFDEDAGACAAWLGSHFEKEHFAVDELVPSLRAPRWLVWDPLPASE
jgi:tetratricopeptide (TPR) repeat protein